MLVRTNTTLKIITPTQAQILLNGNHNKQRSLNHALVSEYARAMLQNRWRINGETIKVASNGDLIDGQHRLRACVQADVSFESYIITGLDADTFDTIDTGRKRSAGDIIGIDGCRNPVAVAAAIRLVAFLRSGYAAKSAFKMGADEIRLFLASEPSIEQSIARNFHVKSILQPAVAGALHFLFSKKSVDEADKFFDDLGAGASLLDGDPVLVLRERLIRIRLMKDRYPLEEIVSLCIRAWNWRRNSTEKMKMIKGMIIGSDGKRRVPDID